MRSLIKNNEQYLIQLARDGLKEDICEGLESTEFTTLEALFQEASEVEEILEMEKTPPTSPRRHEEESEEEEEDTDDWSYEGDTRVDVSDDDMIDDVTDEYIHHGEQGSVSVAEQVSVSGTSSESSAAQGFVCGSNVMAGGGSVADSTTVSGSNSAQGSISGSSAAQGSVSGSSSTYISGSSPSVAASGANSKSPVQSPALINKMSLSPFRVFNMFASIVNSVYVLQYVTFLYGSDL
ncbi:hypothetical protein F2Q70_00029444 [Brassica cretica]|uniref:Uncharacterized protein n=2 Tax=Brassica cretica TaxID=69181 RepID=A0A3N6PL56_BRACR|nr:hypothetical protein F2Q70_00029444 [Brassica cretica]KAF2553789.1 hypothetical protein F2Q68_00033812 [Brassica cretica]KAF3590185.1 hypothetical protein DY000_02021098 [Brassica cretica]